MRNIVLDFYVSVQAVLAGTHSYFAKVRSCTIRIEHIPIARIVVNLDILGTPYTNSGAIVAVTDVPVDFSV
jgi:hypothetical protein